MRADIRAILRITTTITTTATTIRNRIRQRQRKLKSKHFRRFYSTRVRRIFSHPFMSICRGVPIHRSASIKHQNREYSYHSIHLSMASFIRLKFKCRLIQVDESIMDATQTLIKMRALFDNYEADASINEHVTPNERREENEFLNAVLDTQVMRTAMKFLQDKGWLRRLLLAKLELKYCCYHSTGVVTADPKTHYDLLKTIWFTVYSRISGKVGSSGFEHVFLHEIKNNTVGGLHNWVYFYYKESGSGAKPSLDYQGYIKSVPLGSVCSTLVEIRLKK